MKTVSLALLVALSGAVACEGTPLEDDKSAPTLESFSVAPSEFDNYDDPEDMRPGFPTVCSVTPRVGTLAVINLSKPALSRMLGGGAIPIPIDATCHPEDYGWKWRPVAFTEADVSVLSSAAGPELPRTLTLRIANSDGQEVQPNQFFLTTIIEMDGEYYADSLGLELYPGASGYNTPAYEHTPSGYSFPSTLADLKSKATAVRNDNPDTCPYNGIRPTADMTYYRESWLNTENLARLCAERLSGGPFNLDCETKADCDRWTTEGVFTADQDIDCRNIQSDGIGLCSECESNDDCAEGLSCTGGFVTRGDEMQLTNLCK